MSAAARTAGGGRRRVGGAAAVGVLLLTVAAWASPASATDSSLPVNPQTGLPPGQMPLTTNQPPSGQLRTASTPAGAHLNYYGGPVISNVQVRQVLYGAGTYTPEVSGTGAGTISAFYAGVTSSPYFDWLTEYNTTVSGGTNQTIGRGTFAGQVAITPAAGRNGTTIDDRDIKAELQAQMATGMLPMPTPDTLYAVYFPQGKTITSGSGTSGVQFCAYHGTVAAGGGVPEFRYSVLPDFTSSGMASGCGSGSRFQNETSVSSHEMIETVTDPEVGLASNIAAPLAWYDSTNGEIGDICNAQQATVVGSDGATYTVQKEFSNRNNSCIATAPPAGNGSLTNGGFETGNLSGWNPSGTESVTTSTPHSGTYADQGGATTPTNGDSSIVQTFTVPSGYAQLSFFYKMTCPDTLTYDWATATLRDTTAGTTATVLPRTCATNAAYVPVTASVVAGHSYTLTMTSHDDAYAGDASFTRFDDVTLVGAAPANDFSIAASPTAVTVTAGASGTSAISTAVTSGGAQNVSLSATGVPSGATASFSPASVSAGAGSTLTLATTASTPAGTYTVTVTGTGATATHATTVALTVSAAPVTNDFSIADSPASASVTAGSAAATTVTTAVTAGSAQAVALSATGLPTGATASFSPGSITGPGSATMTVSTGASTPVGTYAITITGTATSGTHSATYTLTVTAPSGGGGITNGGFETGSFTGWTTSGSESVSTATPHSGLYADQGGLTTPTNGDSSVAQTFTVPAGATHLTFWYKMSCPDTLTYDWATATLRDSATGTTTTILPRTCATNGAYVQVTANVVAGHTYTLTMTSHDDNYPGDPSYTRFDDVNVS